MYPILGLPFNVDPLTKRKISLNLNNYVHHLAYNMILWSNSKNDSTQLDESTWQLISWKPHERLEMVEEVLLRICSRRNWGIRALLEYPTTLNKWYVFKRGIWNIKCLEKSCSFIGLCGNFFYAFLHNYVVKKLNSRNWDQIVDTS